MKSILRLLLIAAIGTLLAGCLIRTAGTSSYRLEDLRRLPEARLLVPGSVPLGENGTEAGRGLDGPLVATYIATSGTPATIPEVQDFYGQELRGRGWLLAPDENVRGTTETRATTWRKGDLLFHLGILKKDDPQAPPEADRYTTAYTIAIIAEPPTKATPVRK